MQLHHAALAPDLNIQWQHLFNNFRSRLVRWLRPYRPEKHYMRGPGPKCREKIARALPYGVEARGVGER
jgi:hypothetical protein